MEYDLRRDDMATETNNLKLSKAERTDTIFDTLDANNSNFDKIDEKIAELDNFSIPIATNSTIGGVIVGNNLNIDENGVLNAVNSGGASTGEGTFIDVGSNRVALVRNTLLGNEYYENAIEIIGTLIGWVIQLNDVGTGENADVIINESILVSDVISTLTPTALQDNGIYVSAGVLNILEAYGTSSNSAKPYKFTFSNTGTSRGTMTMYVHSDKYKVTFTFKAAGLTAVTIEENEISEGTGGENTSSSNGITVLEASTENVIDFNTLTEEGYYLIKGCSNEGGTTLNSPYNNANYTIDVILEVQKVRATDGTLSTIVHRGRMNGNYNTMRSKTISTDTWSEWNNKMPASLINIGTLASGMKCNTPTEDEHLANKAYVDSAISAAIATALSAN